MLKDIFPHLKIVLLYKQCQSKRIYLPWNAFKLIKRWLLLDLLGCRQWNSKYNIAIAYTFTYYVCSWLYVYTYIKTQIYVHATKKHYQPKTAWSVGLVIIWWNNVNLCFKRFLSYQLAKLQVKHPVNYLKVLKQLYELSDAF